MSDAGIFCFDEGPAGGVFPVASTSPRPAAVVAVRGDGERAPKGPIEDEAG